MGLWCGRSRRPGVARSIPFFVEPPLASSSGESESGTGTSLTAPTTGGTSTGDAGSDGTATTGGSETGLTDSSGATGTSNGVCGAGSITCSGTTKQVCDGMGGVTGEEACPVMCSPGLGCTLCAPATTQCAGDELQACDAEGMWVTTRTCDALQGLSCDVQGGTCTGECSAAKLGLRQVGCDFYGTSLSSAHTQGWTAPYGMIAVNTGFAVATVTVTLGDAMVETVTVPSFGSATIELDYIDAVSLSGPTEGYESVRVAGGAYRVRSTQPLVVYQFEPLEPTSTGDASMLLPVHTWGTEYMVASREFAFGSEQEPLAGFYAVVASADATTVTVTPGPMSGPVGQGGGVDESGAGVVTLDAGDVLEVLSASGGDPTGTRVVADRPVAVFGGHRCANVPSDYPSCDHLEEAIPPISALSREYFVTMPHGPDANDVGQMVRIIATEADTTLTYTPVQYGVTQLALAGDWLEFPVLSPSFRILADKKVVVAQFITGGNMQADPAMVLAVPREQYRNVYFAAGSPKYTSRWVSFIAPDGASVSIDGIQVDLLVSIAGTGFSAASVALPKTASGTNLLSGDQPFARWSHGYSVNTSYWYPAGARAWARFREDGARANVTDRGDRCAARGGRTCGVITVAKVRPLLPTLPAGLMRLHPSEDAPLGAGADQADVGATAVRVPSFRLSSPNAADAMQTRADGGSLPPVEPLSLESQSFAQPGEPGRIHRFAVLRQIGAGGMGVVYAAYDEELDRRVAIKVLRDDRKVGSEGRARMLREAQAMAKLSHPNVVQVYEVGELGGQIFIAMEFIKGKSLQEWLGAEERGLDEILEVFVQAGRGLAAAHRAGIVHRDFKPDNVLIDGHGTARVLDFGLARAEHERASEPGMDPGDSVAARMAGVTSKTSALRIDLTMAGTLMGTPAFMSPEQFAGATIDWRSDQFSMCVALYTAVYKQRPFGERDAGFAELQAAVSAGALNPPPADVKAPTWLWPTLRTGLAVNPAERHPSMDTLLAAISPDRATATRRWLWPVVTLAVAALAVFVTLEVTRPEDPTAADLAAIERYTVEAREAAGRMQWVYPTPEDLKDTSYNRVVLLEALGGAAEQQAAEAAILLRGEFSAALVGLGDRYFDNVDTRPFARDYYVQALLFMPLDTRASGRAGVTVGQLADLGQRARSGEFFEQEVFAAEPLRILAESNRARARERALAFARDPERGGVIERSHLTTLLREEGLLGSAELVAMAEPRPSAPGSATPVVAPVIEPVVVPVVPVVATGTRSGARPVAPTKATPVVTPTPVATPEPTAAPGDPVASKALTAEGDAAMQRGDTATAAQRYKQALDLWNQNAAALMGLSDVAFDGGKFERAASYAEKAVRLEPAKGDYQLRLGDAYYKAFRYSEAEARYERAAALHHPKASERLARVRAELGG